MLTFKVISCLFWDATPWNKVLYSRLLVGGPFGLSTPFFVLRHSGCVTHAPHPSALNGSASKTLTFDLLTVSTWHLKFEIWKQYWFTVTAFLLKNHELVNLYLKLDAKNSCLVWRRHSGSYSPRVWSSRQIWNYLFVFAFLSYSHCNVPICIC